MGAKASKRQGAKSKMAQASVKSVWCAYFLRRAEADRKRRQERRKQKG
jgi:hypothetical protein